MMPPEQVDSWLLPPEDLSLRGGLKGRLAGEFCLLESQVDALTRCLDKQASPAIRPLCLKMLAEMKQSLAVLERLADNAADLARGTALGSRPVTEPVPQCDLAEYLEAFSACANEELAVYRRPLRVELGQMPAMLWVRMDEIFLDGILGNLISNAVACGGAHVRLFCTPERKLIYEDDSRGLDAAGLALLRDGVLDQRLLDTGATGLLIVRAYAAALGWTLACPAQPQGGGVRLEFSLPPCEPDPGRILLEDDTLSRHLRCERLHRGMQRELTSLAAAETE